ncbi:MULTISPECIES: hypothetical protein [Corynebacterium]|uniref:hypothetical protein n=1 Tax=Corynebacterium TaxID=1716 RepID=UPI0003B8C610|nr:MULTISPECIES: hypothetical protein [Corynebacterium]ERS41847.1 hypothetical protein HMPREF1293_01998 [Corynebacterium sp. KPL1996]ERS44676.1 hypothetical protein HMPREF1287_01169 [Corynebacterium sp. KPL1986]ERS72601.1 hypothetical protein HMPREF1295_01528 [Corynebacterium sp. KPL1998]ERS73940.1 hypothetical protein HMPREF1300_00923 [Corynebacterium sp. KPL2004]MCT1410024.1 hypothetical protein [Corynebacterium accolens]
MPTTFPSLIDRLVTRAEQGHLTEAQHAIVGRACARQLAAIPTHQHAQRETAPRPVFRYR